MITADRINFISVRREALNRAHRGTKYRTRETLEIFADAPDQSRRTVLILEHWRRFTQAKGYHPAKDERHTLKVRILTGWEPSGLGNGSGKYTEYGHESEHELTPDQAAALHDFIHRQASYDFSARTIPANPGIYWRETSRGGADPLPLPEGIL